MIANMNEKGRQTKLLAAIAIIAMVVCAFAVVMPSDNVEGALPTADTAITGTPIDSKDSFNVSSGYQIVKANTELEFKTEVTGGTNALYLLPGASITLNNTTLTTGLPVYGAKTTETGMAADGTGIELPAISEASTFTIKNDATNGMTITGAFAGTISVAKITVGSDGFTNTSATAAVPGIGNAALKSATGVEYYQTVTETVVLKATDVFTIYNGSANVSSTYTSGTKTTSVIAISGIESTGGVTITPSASAAPTIGGTATAGSISMTQGTATVTVANQKDVLEGFVQGTTFGATLASVGVANPIDKAVTAYGNITVSEDIVIGTTAFTIAAGATFDGTIVVLEANSATDSNTHVSAEISGTFSPAADLQIAASAASTTTDAKLNITPNSTNGTIAGNYSVDGKIEFVTNAVTIPNGSEMRIVDADTTINVKTLNILGKISGPANGQITATGTVNAKTANAVKPYVSGGVVGNANITQTISDSSKLVEYLNTGYDVTYNINASSDVVTVDITEDVLMNGNKLYINVTGDNAVTFNLATGATWEMTNESVVSLDGNATFVLQDRASLIIDNSNLGMPVNVGNGITDVSGDVVTIDNATGDVTVGFGREYVLTGNIATANIDVIGKLTISGELSQNSNIVVMQGGSVTVDDRFTALGTVTVNVGGTFTIAEGGAMTVGNNNGAASLTINTAAVGADDEDQFVIAEGGSLTIASNSSNSPPNNLVITTAASFDGAASTGVVNNGTLTMNGSMTGALKNNGTMTFNGVVATGNATVYLLENKSITVSAVSGPGTLTVSDLGVLAHFDRSNVKSIDGNDVVMKNVKGVSITSVVDSVSEKGVRYWTASMTVSGAFTSNGTGSEVKLDSVTLAEATTATDADNADKKGNISINAATTVGKNVTLVLAGGEVSVDATVTAGSEGSTVTVNAENAVVTGSIVIVESSDAVINNGEKLSAAMYTVTTTEPVSNTIYYTSFDAALGNISEADEDTIYVYGTTEANTTATIPADTIVVIEGTLKIASDVTLTAADGSDVSGNVIDVKGTFVAEYYTNNVDMEDILADVIRIDGNEYTFTSLANALADAGEGDVIELSAETVVIDVDTQIPVGVTVKSDGSDIVINADVTLTVAGTLDVVNATVTADPDVDTANGEKAGKIVVTGTSKIASDEATEPAIYTNVAGAHYSKTTNRTVYYVSSIANAAANADEYLDNGAVSIIGQVAAEDVTFTKTDKMDSLTVTIAAMTGDDNNTSVTVGKLTLDGAKLVVNASQTKNIVAFSGDVAAMTGAEGSEVESVIGLKGASSITVESYTDDAPEVPVSYLLIDGQYKGAVTISSGAATVGTVNTSGALAAGTVTASGDNVLTVAQNATLVVGYDKASGARALAVNAGTGNNANAAGVVVDGTISVGDNGTVTINGIMDINGTVDVQKSESTEGVQVQSVLNVNGALNISAVEGETGVLNVAGIMYVAAEGAVAGPVAINADKSDYIFAYDGADLSAAQIEWVNGSSTAETTTAYINGAPYMTIYVDGSINNADVAGIMDAADIRIPGLTTPATSSAFVFYSDADCKEKIEETVNVGKYDAVYTKFAAAKVYGTVSEGVGFTLFIDGVPASNAAAGEYPLTVGTHTVSYDIKVGYSGENAQLTFNGQTIQSGATIEITADMDSFTIAVTGATPADLSGSGSSGGDDGMGLTDYLLIILVILIVVMAIMVAMRLMRS